jgi:hypothetical protein
MVEIEKPGAKLLLEIKSRSLLFFRKEDSSFLRERSKNFYFHGSSLVAP